ncbi:MAG TPA: ankyrin repeat domain-containing protein, partial [Candidatus Polarisedimenticolia bacterium]|nr:ankyrin repeat domain-containing protein [Candidatus Polarisedimenticolia bacterium]
RGADVNVVSKHFLGVTPLHGALFGRQEEAVRILIDGGADVRARRGGKNRPRAGWTPLHYAAAYDLRDVMTMLLERGAEPGARDDAGVTPLDVAVQEGRKEAARLLRKRETRR